MSTSLRLPNQLFQFFNKEAEIAKIEQSFANKLRRRVVYDGHFISWYLDVKFS